jgi:rhodanese-related sulfurtransferase
MKKILTSLIVLVSFIMVSTSAMAEVKTWKALLTEKIDLLTVTQLADMIDKNKKVVLIDVREPDEFTAGHIKGAINIPRGLVEFKLPKKYKSESTPFVVYCKSGGRASLAVQSMQMLGYNNVKSLKGAFLAWAKGGNEYYNLHGASKISAFVKKEK